MALKTLIAKKRCAECDKALETARNDLAEIEAREAELEENLAAAEDIDPKIEAEAEELAALKDAAKEALKNAIDAADAAKLALDELEAAQEEGVSNSDTEDTAERSANSGTENDGLAALRSARPYGSNEQKRRTNMADMKIRSRSGCFETRAQREEFFERSEVKDWIEAIRAAGTAGMQQRSVNNTSILIPQIVLELLRNNIEEYSRLLKHCTVRRVSGTSRQPIAPVIPEAVWMEMAGALNELDLTFTEMEMDGYMVGGYFKVPNSILKDSAIDLGEELLWNLLQAVGKALDRAIVYGKGSGSNQPVGFVTRLAATSQPAWWGSKQGTFTDLHSTNVLKLNILANTGVAFFQPLVAALGKASPDYSNGNLVWVMNRKTHMDIISKAMAFDASAALVSQVNKTMPVIGGTIVEEEFMADYEIAGGYMSLEIMAEREGASVDASDQQFFVQNQTVFKGFARYDGKPAKGEGFVIVNYNNTDPTTTSTFAVDYANTKMNTLIVTAAAGSATGKTVLTVSGAKADSPTLKYLAQATTAGIKVGDKVDSTWSDLTSGTTAITAAAGTPIAVVELDTDSRVVSTGNVVSVPRA